MGEGLSTLVGPKSVLVGHTAGSVGLGDRYNSHDHLTAVREVSKAFRSTAWVAGRQIVCFDEGGAIVVGEIVARL